VYGIYDCTQPAGQEFRDHLQSFDDAFGVHSHGDGLISIHPFEEKYTYSGATLGRFFESMRIGVAGSKVVLDDGVELVAGEQCADGSGPAQISLLRWPDVASALDGAQPDVIVDQFDDVVLERHGEVFVLAYASSAQDIPAPPHTDAAVLE
jgi:hypothetical protein